MLATAVAMTASGWGPVIVDCQACDESKALIEIVASNNSRRYWEHMTHTKKRGCFPIALMLAISACSTTNSSDDLKFRQVNIEYYEANDGARARDARDFDRARSDLIYYLSENAINLDDYNVIDRIVIFSNQDAVRLYFKKNYGIAEDQIPDTFAGTIIDRRLLLVNRSEYKSIWKRLYPEWKWTDEEYYKLIKHEMAHAFHENYAVANFGSADAMGPQWFFEGFAVVAAGQFMCEPMSVKEIQRLFSQKEVFSKPSYPEYGCAVQSLVLHYGLRRVLENAKESEFPRNILGI